MEHKVDVNINDGICTIKVQVRTRDLMIPLNYLALQDKLIKKTVAQVSFLICETQKSFQQQ